MSPVTVTLRPSLPSAIFALVLELSTVMATLPAMPTSFAPAPEIASVWMICPVALASSASRITPRKLVSLLMPRLVSSTDAFFAAFFRPSTISFLKFVFLMPLSIFS